MREIPALVQWEWHVLIFVTEIGKQNLKRQIQFLPFSSEYKEYLERVKLKLEL